VVDHHFIRVAFVLGKVKEVRVVTLRADVGGQRVLIAVLHFSMGETVVLSLRIEQHEVHIFANITGVHIRVADFAVVEVVLHAVGFSIVEVAFFTVETSITDKRVQLTVGHCVLDTLFVGLVEVLFAGNTFIKHWVVGFAVTDSVLVALTIVQIELVWT
jgi:hypothetical protein